MLRALALAPVLLIVLCSVSLGQLQIYDDPVLHSDADDDRCGQGFLKLWLRYADARSPDPDPSVVLATVNEVQSKPVNGCLVELLIVAAFLREGFGVPANADRAQAIVRRIAFFMSRFDGIEALDHISAMSRQATGSAASVADAVNWVRSLDSLTGAEQLAEARRLQPFDDQLAKYLERLAAINGSGEATILVARRALADEQFSNDRLLYGYMSRALDAGALDLEPALVALVPRLENGRDSAIYYNALRKAGRFPFSEGLLWR